MLIYWFKFWVQNICTYFNITINNYWLLIIYIFLSVSGKVFFNLGDEFTFKDYHYFSILYNKQQFTNY